MDLKGRAFDQRQPSLAEVHLQPLAIHARSSRQLHIEFKEGEVGDGQERRAA